MFQIKNHGLFIYSRVVICVLTEVMGQKQDKVIEKEEALSGAFNDFEILNQEEEHFNSSESGTHQIFGHSDTSPPKHRPGHEPTRPNDNGEPLLNQRGKKISWSYDTDVSQNAGTPNPQLSPAGGPCTSEFETLINYTTATDREGISSAVDHQHADKTKGMTNKTHPRGSPEMLEGPRPGDSTEEVNCAEKNERQTSYDTGNLNREARAKEKVRDDVGIKRTSLRKRVEDQDKHLKASQTLYKFEPFICDQGWTGRVQQKESATDRLEYLNTDDSLRLETVTTDCPSITGLRSHSTTDSVTGQTGCWRSSRQDLGFQRDRNISSVSPSVTDTSTCVLKEPNGAAQAYSNFTTTHQGSFENDQRNRTFHASLPMLRGEESISHEGKSKLLNIPCDEPRLVQENCLLKSRFTPQVTLIDSFDTDIVTEPVNADVAPVLLRTEDDFEQEVLSTFHPYLKHSNTLSEVLFHAEKQNDDNGPFNVMEKHSTAVSSESLVESSAKKVLVSNAPHPAKKGVFGAHSQCVKRDGEFVYHTAVQSQSTQSHLNGISNTSPLLELSGERRQKDIPDKKINDDEVTCYGHKGRLDKRVCDPKIYSLDDTNTQNASFNAKVKESCNCLDTIDIKSFSFSHSDLDVGDGNAAKASLQQEKVPLYFTAVITPPLQIHTFSDQRAKRSSDVSHLYLPHAEIQSMIPDILSSDPRGDKKTKGPPPPVPKKPKNPFKKGRKGSASHSVDEPREYSDLLLKNIKMGRRQAALEPFEDFNTHPSCLDMLPYCMSIETDIPGHRLAFYDELVANDLDSSTVTGEDPREDELKDLSMSQLRPLLERKAKIKGPPPPVPKKPRNPFAEPDVEKISGNVNYPSKCNSERYMDIVDEEQATPTMPKRYSRLACRIPSSDSSGSEEDELSRFRPVAELIRDTNKIQEKVIRHSRTNIREARPDVTVGSQSLKVSQMKTAFDVKKAPNKMERRSSPKRGKTDFNMITLAVFIQCSERVWENYV